MENINEQPVEETLEQPVEETLEETVEETLEETVEEVMIKKVWHRLDAKGCIAIATEINQLFSDGWEISLSSNVKEFPSFLNGVRLTFVKKLEESSEETVEESSEEISSTTGALEEALNRGVDINAVQGTGANGRVTKKDVVDYAESNSN